MAAVAGLSSNDLKSEKVVTGQGKYLNQPSDLIGSC